MATSQRATARLRNALSGLIAPKSEQEIRTAQQQVAVSGATPIAECPRGEKSTICGVLKSVSLRPRAGLPAVEADLFDGSGHVTLVFLGRRTIAGIEPGRTLMATGRVTCLDGQPMLFNPRYQLFPTNHAA